MYLGAYTYTFSQALETCTKHFGARLLTIDDQVKQYFIESWMNNNQLESPIWLDAIRVSHKNTNSSFIWYDGSAMLYENYGLGEPNNTGEDEYCLFIWPKNVNTWKTLNKWNDAACDFNIVPVRAMCEKTCI